MCADTDLGAGSRPDADGDLAVLDVVRGTDELHVTVVPPAA
ncbi:MAG: hypothetical protein QM733_20455 [Ilumatobacteraceae bacterium]